MLRLFEAAQFSPGFHILVYNYIHCASDGLKRRRERARRTAVEVFSVTVERRSRLTATSFPPTNSSWASSLIYEARPPPLGQFARPADSSMSKVAFAPGLDCRHRGTTADRRQIRGIRTRKTDLFLASLGRSASSPKRQSPMKSSGFTICSRRVTVRYTAAYKHTDMSECERGQTRRKCRLR